MSKKGENIYKRSDGRWEGRYKCGFDESGRAKYKSVYSKSYKECRDKLNHAKSVYEEGKSEIKISMTVKELLFLWLNSILINIKRSTANTYLTIIDNHIIPVMGGISVNMITTEFLNKFTSDKITGGRLDKTGGLSSKTVQNIIGVLKSAFKYAEKIYGIKNPASFVTVPKSEKKEIEVLTDEEIAAIRKYCANYPDYFGIVYEL